MLQTPAAGGFAAELAKKIGAAVPEEAAGGGSGDEWKEESAQQNEGKFFVLSSVSSFLFTFITFPFYLFL